MNDGKHDIENHISSWTISGARSKDEVWEALSKKLNTKKRSEKRILPLSIWIGSAAAALVLAFFIISNLGTGSPQIHNNAYTSQAVWLPDSSLVKLKVRSSLQYNYRKIDGARLVEMTGEAYFEVNKGKRFNVEFPGGELTVLGTKFNIQAYSEKSGKIECFEGAVKLNIHQQEFVLTKGKSLSFDSDNVDGPYDFDADQQSNLSDNLYNWTHRPLKEILTLICQRENLNLVAPESILNQHFTGTINLENRDKALKTIGMAMHFNYKIDNNNLVIIEK